MRRCLAITRIFLFLSIVRFALAAPIVYEARVNVVDGAATSQKRWEDDWLTNPPRIFALRHLQDLQDLGRLPRSSTESNSAQTSPAPSTEPRPRSLGDSPPSSGPSPGSTGQESDNSPPTDHSPTPAPNPDHPSPSHPGLTLTPGDSTPNSRLAGTDSTSSRLADEPYSPTSWWLDLPNSRLAGVPYPPTTWSTDSRLIDVPPLSRPEVSPSTDHPPSPAPNPDRSPPSYPDHPLSLPLTSNPGYTPNSESLLADDSHSPSLWSPKFSPPSSWSPTFSPITWAPDKASTPSAHNTWPSWLSADNSHPASIDHSLESSSSTGPHQSTGESPPNPEPSLANSAESVSKSEPEGFLDRLLKGLLRRRISGTGAVNSV